MPQFVCKNTFISFHPERTRTPKRSRSEEPSPKPFRETDETSVLQLMRLNRFFECSTEGCIYGSRVYEHDDDEILSELRYLQSRLRRVLSKTDSAATAEVSPPGSPTLPELCEHAAAGANPSEECQKHDGDDTRNAPTTIMIRNLPKSYGQQQLIAELEGLGLAGTFDFIHIPLGKGAKANLGYAFVNFLTSPHAERSMQALEGFQFQKSGSGKVASASVAFAHIQGLEKNMQYYANSAVNSAKKIERRPVVVANLAKLIF
jgi:hypothetical protein